MKKILLLIPALSFLMLFGCNKKATQTDGQAQEPVLLTQKEYSKIIAAKIFIQPEKTAEFIELFKGMTERTLTEPGCTGYQLYQDPYDPSKFLIFESYMNQAAIDAHFAAGYFKEYGDKIGALTSQPSEIRIIDVAKEVMK